MNTDVLSSGKKKIWTRIFLFVLAVFAGICFYVMNLHYDTLARYPYQDRRSRELIRQHLNKEEIEYIIEYSIAPNVFISFINEDGFSIYHAAEYKQLSEFAWDQAPGRIVRMVEETRDVMDTETLIRYLNHYTYEELFRFLHGSDPYAGNDQLADNAGNKECYIGNGFTVSYRVPNDLKPAGDGIPHSHQVMISGMIEEPLNELMSAAEDTFGSGSLQVERGYISYEEQKSLYENGVSPYRPGHDEHQLGYAVDFAVEGILPETFELTEQSAWLEDHAAEYGFLRTREAEAYHYRYLGKELVKELQESGMSFDEYGALRQNDIEK
ncbi:MAG: D-alanyl-D-alanine carboxypeptidase family protein [Solobacterium sp.]|nr:D-alanyl-D-alanine carboxypeptidase family protein [Solobacterium sp.]